MRERITECLAVALLLLVAGAANGAPRKSLRPAPDIWAGVACRAMEVHTDAANRMTVVVFHQADEANVEALRAMLRSHSGDAVTVEIDAAASGTWRGTVFRLKSCFGRGLLLFPASAPPLKDGTKFLLRLAAT